MKLYFFLTIIALTGIINSTDITSNLIKIKVKGKIKLGEISKYQTEAKSNDL